MLLIKKRVRGLFRLNISGIVIEKSDKTFSSQFFKLSNKIFFKEIERVVLGPGAVLTYFLVAHFQPEKINYQLYNF